MEPGLAPRSHPISWGPSLGEKQSKWQGNDRITSSPRSSMTGSIRENKRMQLTDWPPEHSAALREYLVRGLSFSRIAQAINAKFKTAYSRSATLGRAKRMGLASSGPARGLARAGTKSQRPAAAQAGRMLRSGARAAHAYFRSRGARQAAMRRNRSTPSFVVRSRTR